MRPPPHREHTQGLAAGEAGGQPGGIGHDLPCHRGRLDGGGRRRLRIAAELFEEPAKAIALEERAQHPGVDLPQGQRRQLAAPEVDVVAQRGELPGQAGGVGLLAQGCAGPRRAHLVGVFEQGIEGAPIADQLGGALGADAAHAGDVVARVAHQGAQIEDLAGRHAEALGHRGGVVAALLHRIQEDDAFVHQLHQVLVGGEDGHPPVRSRSGDQGGDHVVGFAARNLEDRETVGGGELPRRGELGA